MKTSTLLSAAISSVLLFSLPVTQADDHYTGNVSGFLGQKALYDKDWSDLDQQGSLGVIFDFKKESWPISMAVDVMVSGDIEKNGSLKDLAGTVETHLGVRKVFELSDSAFKPYIGGGIALVTASLEHQSNGDRLSKSDDSATGYWVGAGTYYAVNDHFNIGADIRFSDVEVTLFDEERKAGGAYTGISAGYHW